MARQQELNRWFPTSSSVVPLLIDQAQNFTVLGDQLLFTATSYDAVAADPELGMSYGRFLQHRL